jgi:hypothetical protein
MALEWDDRKRLLRMHGIADELLASARAGIAAGPAKAAMDRQLDTIAQEVHMLLLDTDGPAADEFERVVLQGAGDDSPPDVRAAALVGWLKAGLAGETMEAQRQAEEKQPSVHKPVGRKQSIGFKIRSPVTREKVPEAQSSVEAPSSDADQAR